jgi:hypothetical protein
MTDCSRWTSEFSSIKRKKIIADFAGGKLTSDAKFVRSGKFKIKYFKYDWTLNEQPTATSKPRSKTNDVPR